MEKNNKCCIGILKWQLFWEKEKWVKRQLLWGGGSSLCYEYYKWMFTWKKKG